MRNLLALALVPLFLSLLAPAARADPCAAKAELIERTLADEARRVRLWNWGWGLGFAAAGVGQLVLAAEPAWSLDIDDAQEKSFYFNGGKALASAGAIALLPLRVVQPSSMPEAEPCARLAEAERALAATARKQRRSRGLGLLGTLVLNVATGLVLGVGYDLWTEALTSSLVGSAAGLLRLYTQPMGATRALRQHRAGALDPAANRTSSWMVTPVAGARSIGVGVLLEF